VDPELRPAIHAAIASINRSLLRLDKSIADYRKAVLLESEVLRGRYPREAAGLVAFERLVRGETQEAEAPLLAAVAGSRDRALRLDIRHLVNLVQGMAYAMWTGGDHESAVVFSREGLAAARLVFGGDEEVLEFLRGILSSALRGLGRFEEAVAISEEMIASRAALGDDHYATVSARIILGSLLLDLSRLTEAESTLRDALERTRRLAPEHSNTGMAAFYLGWVLQGQGRANEALALHREHLAHPSTRSDERFRGFALWGLGSAEAGVGMLDAGEASLRESLRLLEKVLGPKHDRVVRVRLALGVLLLAERRLEEAEAHVWPALEAAGTLYGDDRLELAEYRVAAGWLRLAQGRPQEAEPLLRRGVSTWEARLPAGDGRVTVARALLGASLAALGRQAEAEPFVAADLEAIGPAAHPLWQRGAREQAARTPMRAGG
jgi:tetratricopeptide (TPR) repeat protein